MVSLERSYVREVLASPFCEGWGWGRIATPARIVPGGLVVGYSGALDGVQSFSGRTGELPGEAALNFRCKGRRVLLHSEGAFGVSIDRNYSSRAWHIKRKVCVMRYRIELSECGSPEQCVIAAAERDYVED